MIGLRKAKPMNLKQQLVEIRHYLHQHPERSGAEFQTTKFLKEQLIAKNIRLVPTTLKTGVIAEIGNPAKGPTIALRADIDALPIDEQTGLSYASVYSGTMHACGHDFHQTSLLGAAFLLKEKEEQLNGLVRLIFQPAEEGHFGAQQVIDAGHLEDVQAIIGYHNHPGLAPGKIGLRPAGIMAAVDQFEVTIHGVGTHAAAPHLGVDVLVTISGIIQNLQSIVARNSSPLNPSVVSVTHMTAGNTWNVLPDQGFFEGTLRSFSPASRELLNQRFVEIVEHTAATYGAKATIKMIPGPPVTFNDPQLTEWAIEASQEAGDVLHVEPSTAGEDFANFQQKIPGVFAFIGSNGEEGAPAWHHSDFIVKDEGLMTAVNYYVVNAENLLEKLSDNDSK